jgi:hypothetical protein
LLLSSTTLAMALAIEHILSGSSCLGFVLPFAVSIAVTMPATIAMVVFPTAVVIVGSGLMSMPRLIFWHIDVIIPLIFHEIDGPAAGIILMTMLTPVFCVSRRNIQIDGGGSLHSRRYVSDYNGCCMNDLWPRKVSDVNAAIKSRLTDAY